MVEIKVEANIGICSEFMGDGKKKTEVSVVISPTRIEMVDEEKMKILTGCNMWKSCFNSSCRYSMGAKK